MPRYKPEPPLLSLTVKLLCTNKQEGTGILYEHNTFGFWLEYCFSGRFSSHIFRIRHLKLKIIQVPQERTKNWVTPKLVQFKSFYERQDTHALRAARWRVRGGRGVLLQLGWEPQSIAYRLWKYWVGRMARKCEIARFVTAREMEKGAPVRGWGYLVYFVRRQRGMLLFAHVQEEVSLNR